MATFQIRVGTRKEAELLFSYPNEGHELDSLEVTAGHYMRDSMQREAAGITNVNVAMAGPSLVVSSSAGGEQGEVGYA